MMEKAVRKRVRLNGFEYNSAGAYHITICTKQHAQTLSFVVGRALKVMVRKQTGCSPFQASFHDHIIRGKEDYIETWHYIENNPLKWSLSKRGLL